MADGIVIGSAFVRAIMETPDKKDAAAVVGEMMRKFKAACGGEGRLQINNASMKRLG